MNPDVPVIAGAPERIVSLVPNLSEVLWWWRLADRVVAVTDWCVAPPRAFDHAQRIRGTKNPDTAAIIALEPDLVIANEEENREIDVRRLERAGVPVHVTMVRTITDASASLVELADVLGVGPAGRELWRSIARSVEHAPQPPRRLVAACPVWRDAPDRGGDEEPWWLAGRHTYLGDLLRVCGFDLVPTDPTARYPRMTLAELAASDPDVVLLPDEPYAFSAKDAEVFAGWRARVRHLDGTSLSWWGPRTTAAIAELSRLANQLATPRRRRSRAPR